METTASKAELRLCARLGLGDEGTRHLIEAMRAGKSSRQAVVLSPLAPQDYVPPFPCEDTTGWQWLPPRVFVPAEGVKPTAYPDYAAGLYYSLDLSSCWESAPLSVVPAPGSSLDMCAAPGGKSMLMVARYLPQSHTANEVNAARRGILRQNMQLCGVPHVEVTGLRPDQWATEGRQFDLLLADAPCSGQSLLCKGIRNPGCLGAQMVNGNAKRQKGILLAAVQCVSPGGHILYSTCTYDPDENEKVMAYILKRVPGWEAVAVPVLEPFRSTLADFPCYRILPEHGFGAGGFCCLLKKNASSFS
ncbi:MAG: RsmB/NOP family class I SAM-dependent RNA methyltransferase [Akkermansia sp.]|nr:RsmB/NOP family class I SAM-dependent RNA methyltransferase [Akkermansia sp.]